MLFEILTVVLLIALFVSWKLHDMIVAKLKKKHFAEMAETRKDAIKRSRASLEGAIYENLVPILPQWKYTPSEARFIGDPIDYVVFEGLSSGEPTGIVIVEVKKGTSTTTKVQNKIKQLIKEGKVRWETLKLE